MVSIFNGNTWLESLYGQDSWRIKEDWRATIGARFEHWRAYGGELSNAVLAAPLPFPDRADNHWSPKAALSWQATPDWLFSASAGRAVRNPTAAELFQGSVVDNAIVNSNPNLKPERSWTGELSAETSGNNGKDSLRVTVFRETTHDDPVYELHGVVHYAVGNMPGAVPHTSTYALTNATLPYIQEVALHGAAGAAQRDPAIALGVNTVGGSVTNEPVAEFLGVGYVDPLTALDAAPTA